MKDGSAEGVAGRLRSSRARPAAAAASSTERVSGGPRDMQAASADGPSQFPLARSLTQCCRQGTQAINCERRCLDRGERCKGRVRGLVGPLAAASGRHTLVTGRELDRSTRRSARLAQCKPDELAHTPRIRTAARSKSSSERSGKEGGGGVYRPPGWSPLVRAAREPNPTGQIERGWVTDGQAAKSQFQRSLLLQRPASSRTRVTGSSSEDLP
jgi:hypothetical protein